MILNIKKYTDRNIEESVKIVLEKLIQTKREQTSSKEFFDWVYSQINNKEGLLSTPWIASWQIDAECNLRCKHCFFEGNECLYDKKNDLSTKQALQLARELANDFSLVNLTITGGEPLLRKDIFEILAELKSKNIVIYLQTNETLVNEKVAKKLRSILNPNLDCVQVSLDGASDEYHNKTRGYGVFQKTLKGIKYLINEGLPVNVNCTALSTNLSEISELYKLCAELHVNKFSLTKFMPSNKSQDYLAPNPYKLFKVLAETIELSNNENYALPFDLNGVKFFDLVFNQECRDIVDNYIKTNKLKGNICENLTCHIHNSMYINSDGKIYFCFISRDKNVEMGDFKKDSLLKIWSKRNNNVFFKNRLACKMLCKKCKYFAFCKGGCMGSAYNSYNDKDFPDGMCLYAKEQFKI